MLSLLFFKALCDSIHSGYVHALADSFLCQHKKLFSVVQNAEIEKVVYPHQTLWKPCQGGGRSHVAHLNFKTFGVGVYNCLSLIVGFTVTVAIWLREVVSCRDFILRTAATFWAMSLVGIYPGRAWLCRRGCPRGFAKLNPSPHSWIFTSISVDSSPHSYLFTSTMVLPIPIHTVP